MRKMATALVAGMLVGTAVGISVPVTAGDLKLPPEVTPALRAACEADVRRLCIRDEPTVAGVRQCVFANFMRLGSRCRMQITLAGLAP